MGKIKFNKRASTISETGFSTNSSSSGGRFYNKDGSPNLAIRGVRFSERFSLFKAMLDFSNGKFLLIILLFYLVVNFLFAVIYLLAGVEHLGGIEQTTDTGKFFEAFFFSAQTLSTVGYGHVYPKSLLANTIAATESVLGLLTFALATGIMYGRFSKPRAYIKYSKNALFAPYKDGIAIMFRIVPYKHNHLVDAEVKVNLVLRDDEDGIVTNRFFSLSLELWKISSLNMNWTIVHPINEDSPFYGLDKEDLVSAQAEMLVYFKAFDESFSSTVISRSSYISDEFIYGARFVPMYHPNRDRSTTVLEIDKLDDYNEVILPEPVKQAVE